MLLFCNRFDKNRLKTLQKSNIMAGEIQRGNQTQQQVAEVTPEGCWQSRGTVGPAGKTITFPASTSILVKNIHGSQNLYVYFRRSKKAWNNIFTTIPAGGYIGPDHRATDVKLRGQGAGTSYEILVTLQ